MLKMKPNSYKVLFIITLFVNYTFLGNSLISSSTYIQRYNTALHVLMWNDFQNKILTEKNNLSKVKREHT